MLSTEAMLMVIYVGLYVYDSALLLCPNEGVLNVGLTNRWSSGFGSKYTTLKGKELYLPNLLAPSAPIFRLSWQYEISLPSIHPGWESCIKTLKWFQIPVWLLFGLSFVVLPTVLFGHFGDSLLLSVFLAIYISVAVITSLLYFAKDSLQISGREFWLAAFDLLICPPFAINVIRRLSLKARVNEDFVAAARRLQTPVQWRDTEAELRERLLDQVNWEDDNSPRSKVLKERVEAFTPVATDDQI